ncbi:DUF2796 domain-containing protein [Marinobacter sp. ATCH36]|uniref:ZrgA family zinc uptake protein n=1 Tax=Marinobacter sp. ATCH36 TaxID=2945106 RepID=UPI00201FD630|nr:DUF2796 domain-containing protein [Marinobacter sp. ATCH36]MCL7943290.1 DUF2796 domain-containing protein [Marinobacter sp. ATCH36]
MPIRTLITTTSWRPMFLTLGFLAAASTLPVAVQAADNPGAHEHGRAKLQIAVENTSIDLIFISPAYNLAGFEHEARTDEETTRLADIDQWLRSTPLVNTNGADCRVTAAAVELGGESQHEDHGDGHHDDHHDHHDEDHHDHAEHHDEATHREYDVSQQLECDGIGGAVRLTSALMEEFDNLEELVVEWVSPSGQGSARLTSSNRAFTIDN